MQFVLIWSLTAFKEGNDRDTSHNPLRMRPCQMNNYTGFWQLLISFHRLALPEQRQVMGDFV